MVDFAPQPTRGAYRSHVKRFDVKLKTQNLRPLSVLAQPAAFSMIFQRVLKFRNVEYVCLHPDDRKTFGSNESAVEYQARAT